MLSIEDIRLMNYSTIEYNKRKNIDFEVNNLINNLLDDKACFFKMKKEDAIMILRAVGVSKDVIENTYLELTSYEIYKDLVDKKLLTEEESVKKFNYDSNQVFSNNKKDDKIEKNDEVKDLVEQKKKENVFVKILNKIKDLLK